MKIPQKFIFLCLSGLIVYYFSYMWQLLSTVNMYAFDSATHSVASDFRSEGIADSFWWNAPSPPVLSWPHIMNLSLISTDDVYVDGWAIKGSSITMSALFPENAGPLVIHLREVTGVYLPCSLQRFFNISVPYVSGYIMCKFSSVSEMIRRIGCSQPTSGSTWGCLSNSSAQTVVISINALIIYVPRLTPFPAAKSAIVLPTLHNDINPLALSRWISHNRLVVGVELIIIYVVYSEMNSWLLLFNQPGAGIVIVNAPQLGQLKSHYHHQYFIINNALLRGIDAVDYIGR
jgi:hypothetical protein